MAVNIERWSEIVHAGLRARHDEIIRLEALGVYYEEARRRVFHPNIATEEYGAIYGKSYAEYDKIFGVKDH